MAVGKRAKTPGPARSRDQVRDGAAGAQGRHERCGHRVDIAGSGEEPAERCRPPRSDQDHHITAPGVSHPGNASADHPQPASRSQSAKVSSHASSRSSAQRQIECSVHVFNPCPCPCGPPPIDEHGRSSPDGSQGGRGSRALFRRRCPVLPQWHRTITSHGVPAVGADEKTSSRPNGNDAGRLADRGTARSELQDDAAALPRGESAVLTRRSGCRPVDLCRPEPLAGAPGRGALRVPA